jgi:hypothetical protein
MSERYLNIPYSILLNPKLTSHEKFILAEIVSLDKRPRGCNASDNHFAKIINLKRSATNGIIKNLEAKGFINIEVKLGVGKKTKPSVNFWELIKIRVENDDTSGSTQEDVGVEFHDTTCRDSLQVGVENDDTTCRGSDTTNTITNTDILLHRELQYTGATASLSVEYKKIEMLLNTDPAMISNKFLIDFQLCCYQIEEFFGSSIFEQMNILKTNQEIYEIYNTTNLHGIRDELNFVKSNMARFLRIESYI